MDKPKNCTECIHCHDCKAEYYGSKIATANGTVTALKSTILRGVAM